MMRVLVTGFKGQLGHDVVGELLKRGHCPVGTDIRIDEDEKIESYQLDITDRGKTAELIKTIRPMR